jgi:hypothetical protein
MNSEETRIIAQLRDKGYAVVVFSPSELRGISVDRICTVMIEEGNDYIDDNGEDWCHDCDRAVGDCDCDSYDDHEDSSPIISTNDDEEDED